MSRVFFPAVLLPVCVAVVTAQVGSSSTPAGSMVQAQGIAAAVLLQDATLLLTAENGFAELWDPSTMAFRATGALTGTRADATPVALADGRVVLIGGRADSAALATAEIYDPSSGLFVPSAGEMSVARVHASTARLNDGRVLVVGGHSGSGGPDAELFDPATQLFTPAAALHTPRDGPTALLPNGNVLVAGGVAADGTAVASAEIYDVVAGTFALAGSLAVGRHAHQITHLGDGRVLVTGGLDGTGTPIADAELFDALTGRFSPAGRLSVARAHHVAVPLVSGEVLLLGGWGVEGVLDSVETYNPLDGRFEQIGRLTEPRLLPAAVTLADGRVLVGGGRGRQEQLLATAEVFDRGSVAKSGTATTLISSVNPAPYGQSITYRAVVTGTSSTPKGNVTFVDGGTLPLGVATVDADGAATLTTTLTPVGERAITAVYAGSSEAEPSTSAILVQYVAPSSTAATLSVSRFSQAYSDLVTLEVTVSGAYGDAPARGAVFKIGSQRMNDEPVPFGSAGGGVWKATLRDQPLLETAPAGQLRPSGMMKIVAASFSEPNPGYVLRNPSGKALLITKEDARPTYDGPNTVPTAGKRSSTATIPLRATIRDIAATADAAGDQWAGDVRLAYVTFINRATNLVIATVPVSLTDQNDTSTGIANYDWTVDIGKSRSQTFTVGMIISNYYMRNSTADDAAVTVSKQR